MWTSQTVADLRKQRLALHGRVALVPTMGALHAGHLSHVEKLRTFADHVLVSIFVNPAQFGANEDLARYPRPLERDLELCRGAGVDGVFNPSVEEIYPPGLPPCDVVVPSMATILEGAARPGHFAGVCRVVLKLFHLVQPHVASFGRKDFQQLRILQAMVADLNLPIAIVEVPTLREPDGLAMSSRNVYLSGDARRHATALFKALSEARMLVETSGETDPANVEAAMGQALVAHQIEPDYAVVRHPHTLAAIDSIDPALTDGVAALVAGRVGGTGGAGGAGGTEGTGGVRLIDNMLLGAK